MIIRTSSSAKSNVLRRALWLAVLPIALLQLTIAVHQFDHVADYAEGACHICIQLDRVDAAVDHPVDTALPPAVVSSEPETPVASVAQTPVRHFDSRAPPQL